MQRELLIPIFHCRIALLLESLSVFHIHHKIKLDVELKSIPKLRYMYKLFF